MVDETTSPADHAWIGLPLLLIPIIALGTSSLCCLFAGGLRPITPIGRALEQARCGPPERLVAAGRRVLDDRALVERIRNQHGVSSLLGDAAGITTRVELADLPEELRNLGRIRVGAEGDRIVTGVGGGFEAWGLIILREGAHPPEERPMVTHREVCPGLWAWGQ